MATAATQIVTTLPFEVVLSESKNSPKTPSLIVPDLFVSFLAQEPELNPLYEKIKAESEEWIKNECNYGPKEYQKHIRADFPYFIAIFAKEAGPEEFRTMCDWCNWVFDFDDAFDGGVFQNDPIGAKAAVDELIATMDKEYPTDSDTKASPLLEVYKSIWYRVAAKCPSQVTQRFKQSMVDYSLGVLQQVDNDAASETPSTQAYLDYRRASIGISPLIALIEYFHAISIPSHVLEHPALKTLLKISLDLIILQNDILSFPKESAESFPHNLVSLLGRIPPASATASTADIRPLALAPQEAYAYIDCSMLRPRYRQWYLALADVPSWGEAIDTGVQKWIRGLERLVLANLNWSFRSERYFGKKVAEVRRTRRVPADLRPGGNMGMCGWESREAREARESISLEARK